MKKALLLAILMALPSAILAQNTPTGMTPAQAKRAEAYFHFSMARVLDQGTLDRKHLVFHSDGEIRGAAGRHEGEGVGRLVYGIVIELVRKIEP